jgi:hypothetical protein
MKTSLTVLALTTALASPAAFLADLTGFDLPPALDAGHLFGAFVVTVLLLTTFADYPRAPRSLTTRIAAPRPTKAAHPLAA